MKVFPLVIAAVLIGIAVIGTAWLINDPGAQSVGQDGDQPSTATSDAASVDVLAARDSNHNDVRDQIGRVFEQPVTATSASLELSKAEFDALQDQADALMEQNGYVDWQELHSNYLSYDRETLSGLAEFGDTLAQTWLAMQLAESDPVAAKELHRQAGIRGSSFSLLQIAQIERRQALKNDATVQQGEGMAADGASEHLPEAVAWGMVALARGDHVAIAFLEDLAPRDNLDDSQLEKACANFNAYYLALARDRVRLGLREFENTPAPLVARDYGAVSVCDHWPVPMPRCRAVTRNGQHAGYHCEASI